MGRESQSPRHSGGRVNWLRFAQQTPRIPADRPAIGFVLHNGPRNRPAGGSVNASGLGDGLPCPEVNWLRFAHLTPPNWVRFAQLAASKAPPAPGATDRSCRCGKLASFCIIGPRTPDGLPQIGFVLHNWLCFAQSASLNRRPSDIPSYPSLALFCTIVPALR